MYQIRAKYSYYSSSYNAPKNGVLRHGNGQVIEFQTRNEAIDYLCDNDGGLCNDWGFACSQDNDGTYSPEGRYVTKCGEYERPSYKIITSKA